MKRPIVTVVAIIQDGNRIVLIKRTSQPYSGRWSLPGGHLEFGETLEQGVKREVREETNLSITIDSLSGIRDCIGIIDGEQAHYVIVCFKCNADVTNLAPNHEISQVQLVNPYDLPIELISPAIIPFLQDEDIL